MNKQKKIEKKRAKRKKIVAVKKQNKALAERDINRKIMEMKLGNKAVDDKSKQNMVAITQKLRETLGLPADDTTPIERLVEAVNLKMKQMKPKEKNALMDTVKENVEPDTNDPTQFPAEGSDMVG